jgi:LysR family transcriptional regulator, hydrogen peroxide-inducible genes activator
MKLAPPIFSLRQLQYAVAIADTLSFRKAAERCHVSQPSLSAQLAALESALDVRLFERDRRRVLVTHAGEVVIARARTLLREADDLAASARRLVDPFSGNLRIGIIPTISPYLLPNVAPALRKRFPRLATRWTEDRTESLVRALDEGELDAALLALEADLGDVEHEVIATDPFVIAAPPDHPILKHRLAHAAELRGLGVLLLEEGHCFGDQALAFCSDARANELEFRATSLGTLTQMVASGDGITLLPELAVPIETERANIAVRRFAEPAPHRTIALVWRKRSPIADALREITREIRRVYPSRRKRA